VLYNEDAFNATKNALYQYGQFFRAVADELGLDKAMKLHMEAYKLYGADAESMLKEAYGDKINLKAMAEFLDETLRAGGWEFQMVEESPKSYLFKHTKCPECEGLFMAGLDAETVEAHCRKSVETVTPYLRKLVPGVKLGVRKWDAPAYCEEELLLEK
jgi:hypothetical protein